MITKTLSSGSAPRPLLTTSLYIRLVWVWAILSTGLICAVITASGKPVMRAIIWMATGLVLLWVVCGGLLMHRYRDPVRAFVLRIPWPWQAKFILFCTLLAMIEEAITTSMTNLAPVFGVPIGQAYITASSNYLEVICFHSVVVFIPMFIGWAWMLSHWEFSPNAVFLIFGLSGTIAEAQFGGLGHFREYGMWTFVYGLMIYLPAYSIPVNRGAKPAKWWHYPTAVILPGLLAGPVAGIINLAFHHPRTEFGH